MGHCLCSPTDAADHALQELELRVDDEVFDYVSHHAMEGERKDILISAFRECSASKIVAIIAKAKGGDSKREFIAATKGSSAFLVMAICKITCLDITPSECIEYAFGEEPSHWILAQISREALEGYRSMKFSSWRKMLSEPTCEAQFRRMLQIGLVTRLYDEHVFPTPETLKASYRVTDERTGKTINLPHPVVGLRVWDVVSQRYESISPKLDGAPEDADREMFWNELVADLRKQHGDEYIARLRGES